MEPKLVFRSGLSATDYTNNYFFSSDEDKENTSSNDNNFIDCHRGNPHFILPGYIELLQKCAIPPNKTEQDYYKYVNQADYGQERECIAKRLNGDTIIDGGYKWCKQNIILTPGAEPALFLAVTTLCCKGDEIIILRPFYQNYPKLIHFGGGKTIIIDINMNNSTYNNMDIIESINNAITNKTKAILLNTPHNPLGIIFNDNELKKLSFYLNTQSIKYNHRIWIISDEPYRDIILSKQIKYRSPCIYYPYTIICYSYGKILLAPSQRIGWMAIPPSMNINHLKQIISKLLYLQWFAGIQIPNIIPGKALIQIENLCNKLKPNIINDLIKKNDLVFNTLNDLKKKSGYHFKNKSLSTFYFMFKPPLKKYKLKDGKEFCDLLRKTQNVRLRPLYLQGMKNWVRISYTNKFNVIQEMCQRLKKFDQFLQSNYIKTSSKL